MTAATKIAVIGASIAGIAAADAARSSGYNGEVHVYDAQAHFPYDKPPMSKGILTGELEVGAIALKPEQHWQETNVELRLAQAVLGINSSGEVTTAEGSTTYDGIILATGSRPRTAPFPIHESVRSHILRTTDDAQALKQALIDSEHVVIIGGGFIGMEVAAAANKLGRRCTVIEAEEHPLGRAVGKEVSQFVMAKHREAGNQFRTGVQVSRVDEAPDGKAVVHLSDGEAIEAETVVLSIGVEPATDFLQGSGLDLDGGVITDGFCQTNLPKIYACGDTARTYSYLYDMHLRIEHWTTAREQGARAAANLIADLDGQQSEPFAHVPYVWSDQFDMKIQIIGRPLDGATISVEHSDERSLTVAFHRDGALCGGVAINRVRDAMLMRKSMHDDVTARITREQPRSEQPSSLHLS